MDEKETNLKEVDQNGRKHPIPEENSHAWLGDICQGIIMAYFLVLAVIYPFYAPGGYMRIGEVKFIFFRNVSLVTLAVVVGIVLLSVVGHRDWNWIIRSYRKLSVTDWFVYGYFLAVMLSYLCSAYKKDALWGAEGWYMGTVTQIIFVFLYFVFSRCFHCDLRWLCVWLTAAAGVFLLGICNRYSVYPFYMEGQTEGFISTLGNINWFCGYWTVTASIGITLYWCSDRLRIRIFAAIYSFIAMFAGVVQGSDSAYIVFIVLLLMLSVLSFDSIGRIYRLLELCMMFAAGCLLGKIMQYMPNLRYNYVMIADDGSSDITTVLMSGSAALWILLSLLACYVLLRVLDKQSLIHTEKNKKLKSMLAAAVIAGACIAVVILLVLSGALHTGRASKTADYDDDYREVFNEDWGNGRGAAWNCGINAYRSMNILHKIVGAGPDCFAGYVYDQQGLADRLANQFTNQRLTNAHNERITLLVNSGVLGWLCYVGIFLTAFVRYMRRADKQPLLYVCAVSILAYTAHNTVSFQQVLSAPFAFIILGIGERLYQRTAEEYNTSDEKAGISDEENSSANSGLKITGQCAEYLLTVLAVALCIGVAFYARDGYHQIGIAKFTAYRNIMTVGCAVLSAIMVPYIFLRFKEHSKLQLSVTDGCVLVYLILSGISVISGGFYKDALWGYTGWNMGLMSQISFVLLYLFLSRFGKHYRLMLTVLCTAACIVYVIGILHRLLIDPIGFYDGLTDSQKAQFLSTLGQNTWYGSFLMVTLPVGMGVFLYTGKKVWRILSGIFMMLGFCTLVTQNSDSAYFALAGALMVFFMISSIKRETMCRFTGALTLFFASGKIMYFLMRIRPNPEFRADYMTRLVWTSGVTWVLLIISLFVTVILYIMGTEKKSREYPAILMRRLRRGVPAAVTAVVVCAVLLIVLQARGVLPEVIARRLENISYFNWNDGWGNGRGRIWRFSAKMFSEADIGHKLFGVGPDCFHSYVEDLYSGEEALLWGEKQLTNAHNEWLNILINGGIFGAAAYLGIYVTAINKFLREHRQNILTVGIASACVSYMCYNFFCYQQVLCTPFVFLLMGIGEYILREPARKASSLSDDDIAARDEDNINNFNSKNSG